MGIYFQSILFPDVFLFSEKYFIIMILFTFLQNLFVLGAVEMAQQLECLQLFRGPKLGLHHPDHAAQNHLQPQRIIQPLKHLCTQRPEDSLGCCLSSTMYFSFSSSFCFSFSFFFLRWVSLDWILSNRVSRLASESQKLASYLHNIEIFSILFHA